MRWIRIVALGLTLMSCGGGSPNWREIGARCAVPRSGSDPFTGHAYPDRKGTLDDEKIWLRAWIDDTYLWYNEVPSLNPAQYDSATKYFDDLKTRASTPSGKPKDQFHFYMPTLEWEQSSQSGTELGYGITWVVLSGHDGLPAIPRQWFVGYVEPGSPADGKIARGAQLKLIDTVNFETANTQTEVDALNAGLFPANLGETHTYTVLDVGMTSTRDVPLQAAVLTSNPVPNPQFVTTTAGNVGYLLFNDHIATAEQKLIDAFNSLKAQNITDLVLDIRYNGGGYLAIASEIAYMIAGSARTSGRTFEQLKFNDKYPSTDPVTGRQISPTPFYNQALGLSAPTGTALPALGLPRVFVLTGPGTCSASESILNGLDGVGVQVIQIGKTTCGKPYGFYPEDNCGTTYFSIQFRGVNAKGFGDYADGFTPAATPPLAGFVGCTVPDDFTKPLGDPGENRFETALNYSVTGACGTPAAARALTATAGPRGDGAVVKSIWRQNRILGMPPTARPQKQ
jgi:C-terminal processing protease CtpA/Prc